MADRAEYERGVVVEREHMPTYQWFLKEIARGHAPKSEEFFLHIVHDHLKEDPNYYKKLSTIETD